MDGATATLPVGEAAAAALEDESQCPRPALISFCLPRVAALDYLIRCYDICRDEMMYFNSNLKRTKGTDMLIMLHSVCDQLVNYAVLLLDGTISPVRADPNRRKSAPLERSPLLQLMYEKTVDHNFLVQLVTDAHRVPATFQRVFGPLLKDLFRDMQMAVLSKELNHQPLLKLHDLMEIVTENNERPICSLVAKLPNFLPALCTSSPGRELAKVSYLGPFLSLSIFLEENPKYAEWHIENESPEREYHPAQSVSEMKAFDYRQSTPFRDHISTTKTIHVKDLIHR